jgi:predicted nucleic acid-binding protein
LDAEDAQVLSQAFEADFWGGGEAPRFLVVGLNEHVLDDAVAAVAAHGLRAYDAVQLASAIEVRRLDATCDTFASFDAQLRNAAAASGFSLLPQT